MTVLCNNKSSNNTEFYDLIKINFVNFCKIMIGKYWILWLFMV